jgi:hypothetical protein
LVSRKFLLQVKSQSLDLKEVPGPGKSPSLDLKEVPVPGKKSSL